MDTRQPYEGENFENLTSNELANFKSTLACWNRLPIPLCIKQPQPNAISIYKLLEKQIVKITSDRGRIRRYLGNFTQTPEGLPYHGEHILSAIEAYIHGKHSQEKAPFNAKQYISIDYTKWYLKRSDHEPLFQFIKEIPHKDLLDPDKQFINISNNPNEIYQIWSKQIGVLHVIDDFNYWKSHNYHYKSSKPLWFNPYDPYIQHILFDDNIRFEEDGSNVIDLYQLNTTTTSSSSSSSSNSNGNNNDDDDITSSESNHYHHLDNKEAMKWENIYYVQADLLNIIKNRNYFIEKVNECEFNLDQIQKQFNVI
uniref:Uncharacterized protein n=1 Tax=Schistosoma haematobium TaxID=6185 RepID=A0A094ZET3_SCHHA